MSPLSMENGKSEPRWGIKFRVPGGREVWVSPKGNGTLDVNDAARFGCREDADKHVARMTGPKSSIAARVVRLPDSV